MTEKGKTIFGHVIDNQVLQFLNSGCEGEVALLRLNASGEISEEITSAPISDSGFFKMKIEQGYELDKNIDHILEARYSSGCQKENLLRPLTRIENEQIISAFSTLITYAQEAQNAKKLTEVSKIKIEEILKSNFLVSDFEEAYNAIAVSSEVVNEIFGIQPESIKEVPPEVKSQIPDSLKEKELQKLALKVNHWNKDYQIAYEWFLDGVKVSQLSEWNAFLGANDSGVKELEIYVGKSSAEGVDRSVPFYYEKKQIHVTNSILPTAPLISLDSVVTNEDHIEVKVHTGAGFSACDSFSTFALVWDEELPVNFNYSCEVPLIQLEELVVPGDEGLKKLRLYAVDREGKVSTPSELSFQWDKTPPEISISSLESRYQGGSSISAEIYFSDGSGIQSAVAFIKNESQTISEVTISNGANQILLPEWNSSARLVVRVTDHAGNIALVESEVFEIDSTAPEAPNVSLLSSKPLNNPVVDLIVTNCLSADQISFSTTSGVYEWQACSSPIQFDTQVNLDGNKNIYVHFKDEVGNISSAKVVTATFDFTPPQIELSFSGANPGKEQNISLNLKDCNDVEEYSVSLDDNFHQWISCQNTFVITVPVGDGAKTLKAKARDLAGNTSSTTSLVYHLDKTAPEFKKMVINPDEAGVGEIYAKTIFVNVELEFTEANSNSKVAFQMADVSNSCSQPSGSLQWESITETGVIKRSFSSQLSTGDGVKKLCAYLEDAAGNISYSSMGELENINFDTIKFETGNIPQVSQFYISKSNLTASEGELLEVVWNVNDVEGLSMTPLSMEYTLNNTDWLPLLNRDGVEITNFGDLSDHLQNYTGSLEIEAPSSSYFRLRLKAVDMAGNDSLMAYSQAFNTDSWSIYAGSADTGIGSGPLSTSFKQSPNSGSSSFVFDPKRGDLYIKTNDSGIIRINSATGKSETLIAYSNTALPDNGKINSSSRISSAFSLTFSRDGLLYINAAVNGQRSKIYRYNPENSHMEWVAGGGSDYQNLTDAKALNTHYGHLALDEVGSIYTFLMCQSGTTTNTTTSAFKLVKILHSGNVEHVAGDCTRASVPAGQALEAKEFSLGAFAYVQMGDIAVKDQGNVIYISSYGNTYLSKIVNGKISRSSLSISGLVGLRFGSDGNLYVANGGVFKYQVSPEEKLLETIVSNDYTKNACNADFKNVSDACAVSYFRPDFTSSGQLMFTDGPVLNGPRLARIRYVSDKSEVVTFAGTKALYGEELDKSVLRGSLGSIYYQQSSTANSAFPEGLYIGAPEEAAIFRVDPSGIVHRHMGSGLGANQFSDLIGRTLSPEISLGAVYTAGHSGALFNFYNGYMYLRSGSVLYHVGENAIATPLMHGGQLWDNLDITKSPSLGYITAVNLMHNIAIKDGGVFFTGAAASSTSNGVTTTSGNNSSSLRFFDFEGDKVIHIMGGTGTNAHVDDVLTDTDLSNYHFNSSYVESSSTFTAYDKHSDRLFFVEKSRWLRYITAPASNSSKLVTIKDSNSVFSFGNLTVHPDGHSIFITQSGYLYCYPLNENAGDYCDGVTRLGPSEGLPKIVSVPNQYAWRNSNMLLINNGSVILQLDLSHL